ncbi:DUF1611 domain-containing protein [Aeoliella mucimassa]|uniref:DUF1611 domain-containing protein n=1 Tax=Aeoliella mucimassa TaxID=2527972 RepID=A0A518AS82_9BACT|nr:DUF1611 domain-containing protein [Aeoliella mucimassa]QDU57579.1 hypothetical protein Pan181_37970 [Aeoliella mucimassa]
MEARRIVILTEGHSNPITAKTAVSVLRYRPEEVVALLDSTQAGKTSGEVLGFGGDTPIVASLDDADAPNTLLIGIAPMGGKLPAAWRDIILDALGRGMSVVSGLHDFLSNDQGLVDRAAESGGTIFDVRKNNERDVSHRQGLREDCLRIHTVGHDCSIGKMVASIEVARELERMGHDAKFVATGQTGIMIEGDGCPVDCVVSDFLNGAVEKLILANQHHDILLFEGQGSLAHPRYSAVTAGLLHGCLPHGLIMVYEAGRETINGMPHVPLTPLPKLVEVYETLASIHMPTKLIGVAVNSRLLSPEEADAECQRVSGELGVVACDVFRHGAAPLANAVLELQKELIGSSVASSN